MNTINWNRLEQIRSNFLDESAGKEDYWKQESDVASYHYTFAQRIGWKWLYALDIASSSGWQIPDGTIVDFGCGSGIATEMVLNRLTQQQRSVELIDRSPIATSFSAQRLATKFPNCSFSVSSQLNAHDKIVLISHVLTELTEPQREWLCNQLKDARAILWVEPGTHSASTRLSLSRELLRNNFRVVAPCTHSLECGMRNPVNARHWCHFFASPPEEAFTVREWSQFASVTGIDLADLPLSFCFFDKADSVQFSTSSFRLIAHAHTTKQDAVVLACNGDGVQELKATKNGTPEIYKKLKKNGYEGVVEIERRGRTIVGMNEK